MVKNILMPAPQANRSLIDRCSFSLLPAPMNLPVSASEAWAKPSIRKEKNMKNCKSSELTARTVSSPLLSVSELAERAVKNEKTMTRHMVLINIFWFTYRKFLIFDNSSNALADQ